MFYQTQTLVAKDHLAVGEVSEGQAEPPSLSSRSSPEQTK